MALTDQISFEDEAYQILIDRLNAPTSFKGSLEDFVKDSYQERYGDYDTYSAFVRELVFPEGFQTDFSSIGYDFDKIGAISDELFWKYGNVELDIDVGTKYPTIVEIAPPPLGLVNSNYDAGQVLSSYANAKIAEDFGNSFGDWTQDFGAGIYESLGYINLIASIAAPGLAPYLNLYTKQITGQDITAADLVSVGMQGLNDFTDFEIPTEFTKVVNAGAAIADGEDPTKVFIKTYGSDFAEKLNLDTMVENTIGDVLGEDAWQFAVEHLDVNQAATDLLIGARPLEILSNQFGDEFTGYISSGDPNKEALGYAGITTAIGLDKGLDPQEALLKGAKEYYDRGGEAPDLLNLPSITGIDIETPDYLKGLFDLNIDLPEGLNWELYGDLGKFEGLDFGNVDWSGFNLDWDTKNTMFEDWSIPELQTAGMDLSGLKLPEIALTLEQQRQAELKKSSNRLEDEEEDLMARTTDNPLLEQDNQLPLSRALLQRTGTLG